MNNCTTEIAWPVGAVLEIRHTIDDAALIGRLVTIEGPLEEVLGDWVQRVNVDGVQAPFPHEFFLARPMDLRPLAGDVCSDQAEHCFKFDPDYQVWTGAEESIYAIS